MKFWAIVGFFVRFCKFYARSQSVNRFRIKALKSIALILGGQLALTSSLKAAQAAPNRAHSSQPSQNPADWGLSSPSADQFSPHDRTQQGGIVEVPGTSSFLPWAPSYFDALQESKRDRKLLLIYFSADYCSWCKKLDVQVLSDSDFITAVEPKFAFYKALCEEGEVHNHQLQAKNQSLIAKFKVDGFPTLLVLDWEENEIARFHYEDGTPLAYTRKLLAIPTP